MNSSSQKTTNKTKQESLSKIMTTNVMLFTFLHYSDYEIQIITPRKRNISKDSRSCIFLSQIREKETGEIIFDMKTNYTIVTESLNIQNMNETTDESKKSTNEAKSRKIQEIKLTEQLNVMIDLVIQVLRKKYKEVEIIRRNETKRNIKTSKKLPKKIKIDGIEYNFSCFFFSNL